MQQFFLLIFLLIIYFPLQQSSMASNIAHTERAEICKLLILSLKAYTQLSTNFFFLSFSIKTPIWLIEPAKNHLQHGKAWYFKAVERRDAKKPLDNQNTGRLYNEPVRAWAAKRTEMLLIKSRVLPLIGLQDSRRFFAKTELSRNKHWT